MGWPSSTIIPAWWWASWTRPDGMSERTGSISVPYKQKPCAWTNWRGWLPEESTPSSSTRAAPRSAAKSTWPSNRWRWPLPTIVYNDGYSIDNACRWNGAGWPRTSCPGPPYAKSWPRSKPAPGVSYDRSGTTSTLSSVESRNHLHVIFNLLYFGPSGPGDHTTGSTALNLGMLHACFDQQGAAAISIVETGKLYSGNWRLNQVWKLTPTTKFTTRQRCWYRVTLP